jgi:hypothetical protein
VHQDLSVGNVYYYEVAHDGQPTSYLKLGDLEYAKNFRDVKQANPDDVKVVSDNLC